jgi:hypothetical protein
MGVRITTTGRRQLATRACCALLVLFALVLFATITGCERGDGEPPTPAFVPSWVEARQALESGLSAWRDRPSPVPASFDIPGVQFVDKTSTLGRRLLSFQVLGQTEVKFARRFTVRLNLEGEESPELVKYHVVGRNPVWVFRLDDYEMFAHWEHDMAMPNAKGPEPPKAAQQPDSDK